jgi:RHS repeat-associated protein
LAQTCGGNETLTQAFSGTGGSRNADDQLTQYTDSYTNSCSGQGSYERSYSYDTAGRVVYQGSSSQGSSSNNFSYDPSGDPTTISSHDTSGNFDSYTQVFDSAGEVTSQTPIAGSHGVSSTYSYDTLGDQAQATAGSATATYTFNQTGQMTSATSTSGSTTYLYTGANLEASATAATPGKLIWGPPTDVDSTRAIDAVTCVSSSFCVAVGASGYVTIYNGSSWSTPTDADSTRTLDALSCVSSSFCVAVDTSGYATIYNGSTWSTPTDIDSTRAIDAVTCVSSSFCVAVGASGYATTYNGSTWSTATDADSTRTLEALSCVSSSFCVAVDTSGYAAKYNGSTWTATDIDSTRSIDTVSCISSSFCVAAGASGYATTYNGSTWSTATDADSSRTIKAVSCLTSSLCVAVDTSGYALSYNGSSWSTPSDIDGSHTLEALSCASSSFCETTDNNGSVLTYNGSAWSSAQNVDSTRTISSVSCTSSSFCVAVDGSGYAIVYLPLTVTVTSQLTWHMNGSLPLVLSDGTNDYIYGPSTTPVEEVNLATSTPTYMTYTPSDSSWLTTNSAGDETGFWGYDAFGNLAFGTPESPFGYAGEYTDPSTGFSNLRARWYEPQTGEFTSRDPAFSQTDTAYTYAGDDPVNETDSTGLGGFLGDLVDIGECLGEDPVACGAEAVVGAGPLNDLITTGGTGTVTAIQGFIGGLLGENTNCIKSQSLRPNFGELYRVGSRTNTNFTPRYGDDTDNWPLNGLSVYSTTADAVARNPEAKKLQVLSVPLLLDINVLIITGDSSDPSHYFLAGSTFDIHIAWAESRSDAETKPYPLTTAVLNTVIGPPLRV